MMTIILYEFLESMEVFVMTFDRAGVVRISALRTFALRLTAVLTTTRLKDEN